MRTINLRRSKQAYTQLGVGNSTFYEWQKNGLMTPGIPLGTRAKVWPDYELDSIAAARIAGKSEDEIRALVSDLLAKRSKISDLLNQG